LEDHFKSISESPKLSDRFWNVNYSKVTQDVVLVFQESLRICLSIKEKEGKKEKKNSLHVFWEWVSFFRMFLPKSLRSRHLALLETPGQFWKRVAMET